MSTVKIWYNPKCSKCREAITILDKYTCKYEAINYLESTPNSNEIKKALQMLDLSAKELMRTKEEIYKNLALENENNEDNLINAMVENPILIERPVLFKGNKAIIGRPTSIIADFIQ